MRNATRQPATLLATALPVGTHAAVRHGNVVTQAVGACDVELSNDVWRLPSQAHGISVCCYITGSHARSAGSSTRPQMLGRGNGRTVSGCLCADRGARTVADTVHKSIQAFCGKLSAPAMQRAAAAYASIASLQRVWKWKGEGIMGVHGHGTREGAHATARDTHLARRYCAVCTIELQPSAACYCNEAAPSRHS